MPKGYSQYNQSGWRHKESTKQKISLRLRGRKLSDEHKRKVGDASRGKTYVERYGAEKAKELIEKRRIAALGHKPSEETRKKISEAHKLTGRKPPSQKGKIGYWKNKKRPDVSGKNHYGWKGGITPLSIAIRKGLEHKEWTLKVFQADGFRCQMPDCPQTERYLNAHHIKTFSKYPGLRFKVNNGITLCRDCHRKIRGKEEKYEKLFTEIIKKRQKQI